MQHQDFIKKQRFFARKATTQGSPDCSERDEVDQDVDGVPMHSGPARTLSWRVSLLSPVDGLAFLSFMFIGAGVLPSFRPFRWHG